jgi:hypothetical protein
MQTEQTLSELPVRFVFVHYHIFKNGGTTIESILRREFENGFVTIEGPCSETILDGGGLKEFLYHHPEILAVSSHQLRYPKPEARGWVIFDCCLVRHPLERLASLYGHYRRADSGDALSLRAKRQTPGEFMRQLLDDSPNLVSDIQVVQLANGGAFTRPAGERDLERASLLLCEMAAPGVVELFDESLVCAEYFLRPAFPKLRMHYCPQNVGRPASGEESLEEFWGEDVHADLLRLNQLDLELYRRAKSEVLRRFGLMPRAEDRLNDFRARNALLRAEIEAHETVRAIAAAASYSD